MCPRWAVIWHGKSCAAYLTGSGWSLDPADARVFETWVSARVAAGLTKGVTVARCWV